MRNLQIFGKILRFPYQRIKCSFDFLSLWDWNFCSIYSIFPEKLRNSEWTRQCCLLPSHPQSGIPWLWWSCSRASSLLFALLLSSGSCRCSLGGLWVAYTVLCWSPSSCQGGWSPAWGPGPGDTRLFPAVCRSPCPLVLPGLAAYSRHPLSVTHTSVLTHKLPWLIIHPQAKFCVLWSFCHREVNPHLLIFPTCPS